MHRRVFLSMLPAWLLMPVVNSQTTRPNFSGVWLQNNQGSTPARTGYVELKIDHQDPDLTIATTVMRKSSPPRHAVQHYRTDGQSSVSTGVDGDEFHSTVVWRDQSLLFSVEEHEDGRVLYSRETWTLGENNKILTRLRERTGGDDRAERQTIRYQREG
jgi:hypothetical protein